MRERRLRGLHVRRLTLPRLERGLLQRAAVRERERPRAAAELVHDVQMLGRELVRLAAGQERDPRHRRRHGALEHLERALGHFLYARLLLARRAGDDHRRLEHHLLEPHALVVERVEHRVQRPLGHFLAALDGVVAVHQHLGLDDGHEAGGLADRSVARERVGVGPDAGGGRNAVADGDHRAPLGELRADLDVLLAALGEAVEAFGDGFARAQRHRLGARIDLDAGEDAVAIQKLHERRAVEALLAERLVVEDHAGDVVAELGRVEQHVAVGAAVLLDVLEADALEALFDGAGGLVGGKDALALGHHGMRDFGEVGHGIS